MNACRGFPGNSSGETRDRTYEEARVKDHFLVFSASTQYCSTESRSAFFAFLLFISSADMMSLARYRRAVA